MRLRTARWGARADALAALAVAVMFLGAAPELVAAAGGGPFPYRTAAVAVRGGHKVVLVFRGPSILERELCDAVRVTTRTGEVQPVRVLENSTLRYDMAPASGCVKRVDLAASEAPFEISIKSRYRQHVGDTARFEIRVRRRGVVAPNRRFELRVSVQRADGSLSMAVKARHAYRTDAAGRATVHVPLEYGPGRHEVSASIGEPDRRGESAGHGRATVDVTRSYGLRTHAIRLSDDPVVLEAYGGPGRIIRRELCPGVEVWDAAGDREPLGVLRSTSLHYAVLPATGCVERVDLHERAPFEIEIVPQQRSFHAGETARFLVRVRWFGRRAAGVRFSLSVASEESVFSENVTPPKSDNLLTDEHGEARVAVPLTAGPARYAITVRVKQTGRASETGTQITIRARRRFYKNPFIVGPALLLALLALVHRRTPKSRKSQPAASV